MPSIACERQCGVNSGRHISASSNTSVSRLKFNIAFILPMRQYTVERFFRAVTDNFVYLIMMVMVIVIAHHSHGEGGDHSQDHDI